jgi:hypothetical protein
MDGNTLRCSVLNGLNHVVLKLQLSLISVREWGYNSSSISLSLNGWGVRCMKGGFDWGELAASKSNRHKKTKLLVHSSSALDWLLIIIIGRRDRSVRIATAYGLYGRGSTPNRARDFSLLHCGQTGFEGHLALYPMGTRGCFPGGKPGGAWSWPFAFIWIRGQQCWSYNFTLLYAFMTWRLIKNMGNFTFIYFYYSYRDIWKESKTRRREVPAIEMSDLFDKHKVHNRH